MLEITGDLWEQNGWIVVPTNLVGVFGRGVARQARDKFPDVEGFYRKLLREGMEPRLVFDRRNRLILFPVKFHWKDKADLHLITDMVQELATTTKLLPSVRVYLPLVGCGFGNLTAHEVLPILRKYLDDRFVLVHRGQEVKERYPQSFRSSAREDISV